MDALTIIFFISIAIILYSYLGYGILLGFLVKIFGKKESYKKVSDQELPDVALLIAAYNEQDYILQKIENCLEFDYPKEKLHLYFVTDGSNDLTPKLASLYAKVKVYHSSERKGKMAAVDRVMKEIKEPITIYSDANAMVNKDAIKNMVRHFQNEKVGAVAGEKSIAQDHKSDATSAGEGIYWKYESLLKRWDYRLYSVVGAAGELFAIRTQLYEKPAPDTLIEDFVMTLKIAQNGFRVAYEPEAKAYETASAELSEEMKRKVRISAGGLQAIWRLRTLLNPLKYGVLSFQYISHRVLRWTLAPLALVVAFISNLLLAISGGLLFESLFIAQLAFYAMAFLGYLLEKNHIRIKALFIPLYFTFMNLSVFLGLIRLSKGSQTVIWAKAKRK